MHAGFNELSEIAAGRRSAGTHVAGCPDCRTELERLRRLREGLAALPGFAAPPVAWPSIRARAARTAGARRRGAVPAALAASLVAAAALAWLLAARPSPPADAGFAAVAAAPGGAPVIELVAENARLEALLSQLPQSRTTRLGTAYTVAAIEDRLALVDDHLTTVTLEPYAPEVAEDLWRERVTLMNSLVQVHYARALATR